MDSSAFAIKLSRAVGKAVRVGETGFNWGDHSLSVSAPPFCRLPDFTEIETKWGVTLDFGRSLHTHPSSLADRQGREKLA